MVAIGITSSGNRKEFEIFDGRLFCYNKDLVSLEIPEGVKEVYCSRNKLTELVLPSGVTHVYCYKNQLTELVLTDSVTDVRCDREVKGLEHLIGKANMRLW